MGVCGTESLGYTADFLAKLTAEFGSEGYSYVISRLAGTCSDYPLL